MFMAGTGTGGCGHGQGPGSNPGHGNPRKFSEKIALLTQRQAEDTAAFQEVMMDITSTRIQVQRARQARSLGPYYGGSLPNVNQIGRYSTSDVQGQPTCGPDSGCPPRRHPVAGEGRLSFPVRPSKRHADSSPYHSAHLSLPPESSWRRNWPISSSMDRSQLMHPSITALNRTNSDSALHTSVKNIHSGAPLSPTQTLPSRTRHSVFPYPVPPIEENVLEDGKLPKNARKTPGLLSGLRPCGAPGINILSSPDQQYSALLSASGSLPDLSSLHLPSPSPQPLEVDPDPLGHSVSLNTASSTGHLPGPPSDLGLREDEFHLPGLSSSLQGSFSNPLLQSFLSNPNIQSSLSSHSLPSSLSSASLNLSLSNPSLQSCPSNQSLQSFLSNSSLSGQSAQSAASHCSYSSGIGGSRSCSSSSLSCSPRSAGQSQGSLSRRRTPLSPLVVPIGGESRWHQAKQFSPVGSPTLSSITQGVLLNTNQLPKEMRTPAYPLCQPQHQGPEAAQQHRGPPQPPQSLTKGMHQQPGEEPNKQHQETSSQKQQQQLQAQETSSQQQQQQQQGVCQQVHYPKQQQQQQQLNYQQHQNQLYQSQFQQSQTQDPSGPEIKLLQQHHTALSKQCPTPQRPDPQHTQHQIQYQQQQQHYQHQEQAQKQPYQQFQRQQPLGNQRQQPPQQQCLYPQHLQQPYLPQQQTYPTHQPNQMQQPQPQSQPQSQPQPQPQPQQPQAYQQPQPLQQQNPYSWHPPPQSLDMKRRCMSNLQKVPKTEVTRRHQQNQVQEKSWTQQKLQAQKNQLQLSGASSQTPGLYNNSSIQDSLQHDSYMGLHLTPSQTQALSQQLGRLSKEPPWGEQVLQDSGPLTTLGKHRLHDAALYQDMSGVLPMFGFETDPFSLVDSLQMEPLDLEGFNLLSDGDMVEDAVKAHCSNLLR